ncbi:MAG: hypothetical protein PF637_05695 [Spirochaetes bacterium]|jgi:hypothetical protein|nr:hypothetical protein [Spirochaetota bacterium]
MNKKIFMSIVVLLSLAAFSVSIFANGLFDEDVIERIQLTDSEIPGGFVYGTIPPAARKMFKANPWKLDQNAVNRLTKDIYPNGNYQAIKAMHLSIITRQDRPYSDDLVCYIIVFKNAEYAKREIAKLHEYVTFNKDRQLVYTKSNIAVLLMIDDAEDFSYIQELGLKIEQKLLTL